ncbi:response regulator transcription factor [Magnetospirillum sulfuroxidans]|uniref:Response regulator transcription factor n=1 Tax=Magnetospirillum sulfuroxidans TaxID=611300 RepID=A0ABS5IGJ5_9PROT|nr:response regulator transcription factor [Magnetospirillum sulfuroxidans]MBR9973552.1 response regulator transcription factor [Magnetospirillum sulfuroxidans]
MSVKSSLLVVDDDETVRALIVAAAVKAGYRVEQAEDAAGMRAWLATGQIDLVVLDVNLPDGDGLNLTRDLRTHSDVGVIMVTERGGPDDRALGIEIGADDYLPKPVYPRELLARVKSVLERRAGLRGNGVANRLRFAGWTLDIAGRAVLDSLGRVADLTPAEFDLLHILASRAGRIQSRDVLMAALGSDDAESGPRSIDILISRLRKKLGSDDSPLIETCRGHGYRFVPGVSRG